MSLSLEEFAAATYEEWRQAAEESLKGAPFDKKLITPTPEGIRLQPIYRKEDLAALELPEAWPGLAPFTRGSRAAGFKREPWFVAQELPYGCAEKFNTALKSDLMRGQNATPILPDTATRRGQDPDAATVGDVGQCGLSLATREDAAKALDGIDLTAAPVLAFAGASALPIAGLLASVAGESGLAGAVLADPLTEWARDGQLPLPLEAAYAELTALTRWGIAKKVRTVGIQASLWGDAGGTAVEELAFGIAAGAEYLRVLGQAGIDANAAAPQFVMSLSLGSNFFMQIAKLRAARLLWAKVLEAFGAQPVPLFIHARTSVFNKSSLDPHTNMLRATSEAFAAAVGGADSLHIAPFDETIRQPDEFSRRIARNVHVILAEECNFSDVADAAGGSWFVESLTLELAKKAWALFQDVEKAGGLAKAIEAGMPQQAVAKSAAARLDAVAKRREPMIGVNLFPNPSEKPLDPCEGNAEKMHAERGKRIAGARKGLAKVDATVEAVAAAFASGATLGEISAALPRTGAPAAKVNALSFTRAAAGYEGLRAAARQAPPKVWLAKFGPPKQSKARADFSSGFFAAGGYDVKQGAAGAKTTEDALSQAVAAAAPVVVVCSSDDTYPEIVPAFVPALKEKLPGVKVILAGYPPDQIEAHKASGVDDFIHIKVDCLAFLKNLHSELGL
ncbi:MAG: methylmalonyl-CoA mutase family protein [Terrimicrobiaceae bacterium]|nr:methylmalonyl-CoA mutase family protein [Terrimicrobiaceae bacterium]